jgi:ribose transport system substrate-binding protein
MKRKVGLASAVAMMVFALSSAGFAGAPASEAAAKSKAGNSKWKIGVSNSLAGNSWREEMICAVKAEVAARTGGKGSVVVMNRTGGPVEQAADIAKLIDAGVKAIVLNPSDRDRLNPILAEAQKKGVVIVAVDQPVSAPGAYFASTDQVAYGRLGATWLFKTLGGKGNVVEMRGIEGVAVDTDRHRGFTEALKAFPGIKVVKTVFTRWDFATSERQAVEVLNSGEQIDGFWTSGTDMSVVAAFAITNKPPVPVVGTDNNGFIKMLLDGKPGAVVTNPAVIGGVGASIALSVLDGKKPTQLATLIAPQVWDQTSGMGQLQASYFPQRDSFYSAAVSLKPYTNFTSAQLFSCK